MIPSGASLTSTNAQHDTATVLADVIQVQWQGTDREILSLMSERNGLGTGTSAPKAVAGAAATPVTATPTTVLIPSASSAPPSATSVSTQRSSGLSAGSQVAIGISVPLCTLFLTGIGLCLFFRRRKAGHNASSNAVFQPQGPMHQLPQEMDVPCPELLTSPSTTEIGGSPIIESGGRALHEVQSKTSPRYTST